MTNRDSESSSEYETTSEYLTSDEDNFNLKKIDSNNQDIKLVDYSELNCGSCEESNYINIIIILLIIITSVTFIFRRSYS